MHLRSVYYFLFCFCLASIVRADLVMSLSGLTKREVSDSPSGQLIAQANQRLRSGDREGTRTMLRPLIGDAESVHPDVIFADLLNSIGARQDARQVLEQLAVSEPKRIDIYLAFTELAVGERRWFDGWNLANLAIRLQPPSHWTDEFATKVIGRIELMQAVCLEGRKEYREAAKIYEKVLKSQASSEPARLGLARTQFFLGNADAALATFAKARQANPQLDLPQIMLAGLYEEQGGLATAGKLYESALNNAAPADREAIRLRYARWLFIQNDPDQASLQLKSPSADEAIEEERQFLQALVARMKGEVKLATTLLTELQTKKPNSFPISNHLALVLVESTDTTDQSRAMELAEQNVKLQPLSGEAWATLGWIQFRLNKPTTAKVSLTKAQELGPITRDLLFYLLQFNQAIGDASAVQSLTQALKTAVGPDFFKTAR